MTAIVGVLPNGYAWKVLPRSASEWVKEVRKRTGLTQEDFAARLGVGRTTVADWERGQSDPEWDSIHLVLSRFPAEALPQKGHAVHSAATALERVLERHEAAVTLSQARQLRELAATLDASGSTMTDTGVEAIVRMLVGPKVVSSGEASESLPTGPPLRRKAGES